jgi:hypothetical protein
MSIPWVLGEAQQPKGEKFSDLLMIGNIEDEI